MESFTSQPNRPPIESQANSQEHPSLLLFSRLRTPAIRDQIINLILEGESTDAGKIMEFVKIDEEGNLQLDSEGKMIIEKKAFVPRSREQVEKEYDENLEAIESHTPIVFDGTPTMDVVAINWRWPKTGEEATLEQKAGAEAHEKGHNIRHYGEKYFDDLFKSCIDPSLAVFDPEDEKVLLQKGSNLEDAKRLALEYIFSAKEIAERMSQLKNYFGFNADEEFTIDHLHYAKEHYVNDTGMDNYMTQLFQAIPPEKEDAFVELMNRAGI